MGRQSAGGEIGGRCNGAGTMTGGDSSYTDTIWGLEVEKNFQAHYAHLR